MLNISSYVTVVPIIIICYLLGLLCKAIKKVPDRYVTVIVGTAGGIIAIPAMYIMPAFPATDIITAISVGVMSGLMSTGVNQLYKKVKKDDKNEA
jgi:hypothetical protein